MKLPTSVKIGPHTYRVASGQPTDQVLEAKREAGNADHALLRIRISSELPASVRAEVLLHEVLHCIWDQGPLRNRDDDLEEDIVAAFAPLLLDTLRRNPALTTYLLDA